MSECSDPRELLGLVKSGPCNRDLVIAAWSRIGPASAPTHAIHTLRGRRNYVVWFLKKLFIGDTFDYKGFWSTYGEPIPVWGSKTDGWLDARGNRWIALGMHRIAMSSRSPKLETLWFGLPAGERLRKKGKFDALGGYFIVVGGSQASELTGREMTDEAATTYVETALTAIVDRQG